MLDIHKEDEKAMISNRYNRTPHAATDTKRERNTYNQDGIKIKSIRAESQEDSSFPADDHRDILNKMNKTSKTNRNLTNIDK